MKTRTVIVCADESIIRLDLNEMLQESGFDVVAEAVDGYDAIRLCKPSFPYGLSEKSGTHSGKILNCNDYFHTSVTSLCSPYLRLKAVGKIAIDLLP